VSIHSLFQSGMDLGVRGTTRTEDDVSCDRDTDTGRPVEQPLDHFIVRDGQRCAGIHLIIDLHGADRLDDRDHIEAAMRRCVTAAGATLLHIHLHRFAPAGVSGVAVLAESHISVHTWPENGYAAFDVFMCGDAVPEACVPILRDAFGAERVEVTEVLRGIGA
jgi:S-adenosylmethionine decarboxylase